MEQKVQLKPGENRHPEPSEKVFILDTNVLLVDPNAIDKFEDNVVVVSMTVMEELDGLKKRSNTEYEARQAINAIVALTTHKKPGGSIDLRNGGAFILDSSDARPASMDSLQLNLEKPDNRIIATAIRYRENDDYPDRVVIVTNDSAVRIKAHAVGIASEEYTAVNYNNGVDDLYQPPPELALDDDQVNRWVKGEAVEVDHGRDEPVLVRCAGARPTAAYLKDGKVFPYGALFSELVTPLNSQQELALQVALDERNQIVAISGQAGTGKTILALAVAIEDKLLKNHPGKVYIFRPNDQLADEIGFLPGNIDEKFNPYKRAIRDAYEVLQQSAAKLKKSRKLQDFDSLTNDMGGGKMPILPINFIRGSTLHNAYIIIDEAQNFTPHQMKTLLTRAGRNTRVIITGDPDQIDNRFITRRSCGLTHVIGKMRDSGIFAHVNLTLGERSDIATIAAELL
jgi:PhoH-like ATPase